MKSIGLLLAICSVLMGCMVNPQPSRDLSVYQSHMPKSILVLPPINESPDPRATYGYWSSVMVPLAEAGYYVFPMSIVDVMFKENGISNGFDAQSITPQKLQKIFGADAALYIKVKQYGSKYQVVQTVASVAVEAKLVDLKTGQLLWQGQQQLTESSAENNSGLIAMLVGAVIEQISNDVQDKGYLLSQALSQQLYTPQLNRQQGLLYGPRSPYFPQNTVEAK
ncbi:MULTISPECIES: DUF799 domain-containing protein [unclassified Acinetobacter]|uniref:DUF799 domain-containing protein n=1 Tax=unclassified Acinetobacter TaxID=196816 RepID=UPI002934922E|nr:MULTISPECIES: GNA1162 family protein [unclassified Acinetobacter]WOE31377.1 DUF799 family lipoprotein [Acinetobacter sp. SAAs470]WOE39573.1 DUF799 family lipoprotein [Acinetobacter sp. SAAs474]